MPEVLASGWLDGCFREPEALRVESQSKAQLDRLVRLHGKPEHLQLIVADDRGHIIPAISQSVRAEA